MEDNYNYSMDAYWPNVNLTEKEMELIDEMGRTKKILYNLIMAEECPAMWARKLLKRIE